MMYFEIETAEIQTGKLFSFIRYNFCAFMKNNLDGVEIPT